MRNEIKTGLEDLDLLLDGGLNYGDLTVIGARPAMGKTTLMMTIASNMSKNNLKIAYISLAENFNHYVKRVNIMELSDDSLVNIEFFDDVFDINNILSLCRTCLENKQIKIFFIDYLQILMRLGSGDLYQESSKIINELKIFAMENDVCIILASQLSRKVEERQGHQPMLTDFRDTGAIEDAADQVIFILRPEYYDPNNKPGLAELIVAKNRCGKTGTVKTIFNKEKLKFEDFKPMKSPFDDPEANFAQFSPAR